MTENKVDLGSIQIHKKVIGEIAAAALDEIDGVHCAPKGPTHQLFEAFGKKATPGIVVTIDKDAQVTIELKVYVRYGINIPDAARQIQDVVRLAVERTTDVHLREVNVNVQGIAAIERGKA